MYSSSYKSIVNSEFHNFCKIFKIGRLRAQVRKNNCRCSGQSQLLKRRLAWPCEWCRNAYRGFWDSVRPRDAHRSCATANKGLIACFWETASTTSPWVSWTLDSYLRACPNECSSWSSPPWASGVVCCPASPPISEGPPPHTEAAGGGSTPNWAIRSYRMLIRPVRIVLASKRSRYGSGSGD